MIGQKLGPKRHHHLVLSAAGSEAAVVQIVLDLGAVRNCPADLVVVAWDGVVAAVLVAVLEAAKVCTAAGID